MRNGCLVASLVLLSAASQGLAEEGVSTKKLSYALLPEGKTLPAGVARFRLPYQMASGSSGYDADGKKVDSPVKFTATGGAIVAEYGLTDKISLQWKTDYVVNQKAEINRSSATFAPTKAAVYAEKTAKLAPNITDQASLQNAIRGAFILGCVQATAQDAATCGAAYESGALKSTAATALGLASTFGAGNEAVSAKAYATAAAAATESKIEKGMSPSGKGMGDTILGVLYEAYDSGTTFVALAGGIRIPTGNHDLKFAELDSTRGAWEAGARINVDLLPVDWFMVSWQNQSEVGLFGATHKEDGMTVDTKRNGVRNVGFIYLKPSLAAMAPALESLRASIGLTYDLDSALVQTSGGVETTGARSEMVWNYASLGYSFIGMEVPLQFDVEHEMPNRGKNSPIAATKTTYTLKAFARF
ncbi:MAG: transporter [bacterium]